MLRELFMEPSLYWDHRLFLYREEQILSRESHSFFYNKSFARPAYLDYKYIFSILGKFIFY